MSDIFHTVLALIGACFAAATVGGSLIFGVATVCRWMKWAPVNTTINVNNYGDGDWSMNDAPPRRDRKQP